jgi:hypothetical protein
MTRFRSIFWPHLRPCSHFVAGIPWVNRRPSAQHAASIASLRLTTEAVVTQIPEEHKNAATPGGGMGGGIMY